MKKLLSLLMAVILVFGGVAGLMLAHPQSVKAATSYYVNDNITAGDVYCSAIGDDANNGTSPSTPKRTIQAIINAYDLGCIKSPEAKQVSPLALWDLHYLRELDNSGFIDRLYKRKRADA